MPATVEIQTSGAPKRVSLLAALSFVIAWVPPLFLPALVLALVARREIREHQGSMSGKGLTTSAILVALMTPLLLIGMSFAYRKNMEDHRTSLRSARVALNARQTDPYLARSFSNEDTLQLMEDVRRMETNPPSFFNPFGW